MRIYMFMSPEELMRVGAYGIEPYMPSSRVNMMLQRYISSNPRKVDVGGGRTVNLTTKAIYGSLVSSALNISSKYRLYKKGEIVFVHIRPSISYPIVVAPYKYRLALHSLILLKENAPEFENGNFRSVREAMGYYVKTYWDNVMNIDKAREAMVNEAKMKAGNLTVEYVLRSIAEEKEVLIYQPLEPEYMYVKLRAKEYEPFMDWLYRHRGLYKFAESQAKTKRDANRVRTMFKHFMERYRIFKEKAKMKNIYGGKKVALYVPPRW